ncbi:MAG: rhomboid family intramembrane serine protease [Agitococcus sp.]|nr:rhomboid family intramembrane serine protease [Agitococcus sp.]
MLLAPTDKPFDYRQPPRLSLGLAALLLVLFAWLTPSDNERMSFLNDYYAEHLLKVEWPLYPTHLLQSKQVATLDKLKAAYQNNEDKVLTAQMGFDRDFTDSITNSGRDFLEPEIFSQWQQDRQQFNQQRDQLRSVVLGLDPQRFRPITYFTYAFLDNNSLNVLASAMLLLLVGMAIEWAMGSGALLSAWLVGSLCAGISFSITHFYSVTPLIGSAGAISGVLGLAFMHFRHANSLTVMGTQTKLGGWLFLGLFILLTAFNFLNSQFDMGIAIGLGAAFISGIIVCIAYHRWFTANESTEDQQALIIHDEMPADELYRHELHSALQKISLMQFTAAERQLRELAEKYPQDKRILEHCYHLLKFKPAELEFEELACGLFALPNQPAANHLVLNIYNDYKRRSKTFVALDSDTCLQLAMRFARIQAFKEAEDAFKRSLESKRSSTLLKKAALALSQAFTAQQQEQRAQYYQRIANEGVKNSAANENS